jgi:hypothetical protein
MLAQFARERASGAGGIQTQRVPPAPGRPTDGATQGIYEKAVASLGYLFVTVTPKELKVEPAVGHEHSRRSRQNINIVEFDFMKISSLDELNEIMRHESEARRMSFAFSSSTSPNSSRGRTSVSGRTSVDNHRSRRPDARLSPPLDSGEGHDERRKPPDPVISRIGDLSAQSVM